MGREEITFEVFVDMEPMCLRRGIVDFKDHIKPNILTIHDEHPSMVKARELLKELYQVDELDTSASMISPLVYGRWYCHLAARGATMTM